MDEQTDTGAGGNDEREVMRTYTGLAVLLHNVPYILMTVLGSVVLLVGLGAGALGVGAAVAFLVYGAAGALWIMIFVCPFCRYWGTDSCPCGYGRIAERLRARQSGDRFGEKFKKHIPVIVPLWIIPVLVGVPALIGDFSWGYTVLLAAFAVDAYVVLPLFSRRHGCKDCPQKDTCPWMGRAAGQPA